MRQPQEHSGTAWTCPKCGAQFAVILWPVRCACGHVQVHPDVQKQASSKAVRKRREVCRDCDKYKGNRCVLIDLGCSRTFKVAIQDADAKCPLGRWSRPLIQTIYHRPSITRTNLIYHVCPIASNDVWRHNLRRLKPHLRKFTGRKLVAVAHDDGLLPADAVKRELDDDSVELLPVPNDPDLREVASFLPLLEEVRSVDPAEATFYAHSKGNSTRDNALGAEMWRNAMYHHLLDHSNVCRDLLLTHPCVGTHKMVWPPSGKSPFPSGIHNANQWMYAGTFFWLRNKDVFSRDDWRSVQQDRYGAEAWLGQMFPSEQAATVFQPWPASEYPIASPYDPALYFWPIRDY